MHDHVESILRGGPLAGIMMVAAGIAAYCYHAAMKFFADAHAIAQAAAPAAPAWDSVAQAVPAILTILGGVITWLSLQRNAIRRANRDDRLEDALADIRIQFEKQKAALAIKHAENARRLDSQDRDLADIKQAVATPTPTPEPKG